jgi:hypothetical protein
MRSEAGKEQENGREGRGDGMALALMSVLALGADEMLVESEDGAYLRRRGGLRRLSV